MGTRIQELETILSKYKTLQGLAKAVGINTEARRLETIVRQLEEVLAYLEEEQTPLVISCLDNWLYSISDSSPAQASSRFSELINAYMLASTL